MIPRTTILLCVGCMFAHSFNSYLWVVPIKKKKKRRNLEQGVHLVNCIMQPPDYV